jgi:hypothetical protein
VKRWTGLLVVCVLIAATASAEEGRSYHFDGDKADAPPAGFRFGRTGQGKKGRWVVKAAEGAPSGANVLAQVDTDNTDYRFPVAVADEPRLRDLKLSVRCKPVSGKVDQACGLVFRFRNAKNYYVARANALENNVRLYYVKNGRRRQIASYSGKVTSGEWHELAVTARGEDFEVRYDGKKVIGARDKTFSAPGRIGVWTKADSVTYFDDLTVSPP